MPSRERKVAIRFQSTPPAREATGITEGSSGLFTFQSTPPAREATLYYQRDLQVQTGFNPRLPHGRRLNRSLK